MALVRARQSVREYSTKTVEREKLERCLEAARLAPSACNSQPWMFVIVDDPPLKEAVARETFGPVVSFNRFALQAPVIVAVVMEPGNNIARAGEIVQGKGFRWVDLGIATEHFCLQAAEEGLGTCIMGWFRERRIKRLLGIPRGRRVGLLIAVGYPASPEARVKERKDLDGMRRYNGYQ